MRYFLFYLLFGFIVACFTYTDGGKTRALKEPPMVILIMFLWPAMAVMFWINRKNITIKKGSKMIYKGENVKE